MAPLSRIEHIKRWIKYACEMAGVETLSLAPLFDLPETLRFKLLGDFARSSEAKDILACHDPEEIDRIVNLYIDSVLSSSLVVRNVVYALSTGQEYPTVPVEVTHKIVGKLLEIFSVSTQT